MKKVLLKLSALALLLTCSVGMWAQADDIKGLCATAISDKVTSITPTTQWYLMKQQRNGLSSVYDAGQNNEIRRAAAGEDGIYVNDKITDANLKYLVRFIPSIGDSYNIQFATGNYFNNDDKKTISSATAGKFLVYPTTNGGDVFGINLTSDGTTCGIRLDNNGAGNVLSFWGESTRVTETSGNNVWEFYAVTIEANSNVVDITYVFKNNGTEVYRETKSGVIGDPLPTPSSAYGITYTAPTGTATKDETINIDFSYSLPFAVADSYANVTSWYSLGIHTDKFLLKYVEGQTSITLSEKTLPDTGKDAYEWAFVGNPFEGFKIVNKAAGSGMVLSNPKDGGDDTRYPVLKTESGLEGSDVCEYFIQPSTNISGVEGFYIGYEKGGTIVRMNKRGSNLAYWDGGADAGSTFTATLVESSNEKDITYVYKHEGVEVGREKITVAAGQSYPVPTIPGGCIISGGMPSGSVTASGTFDINITYDLPFDVADSYANVARWYNLKLTENFYLLKYVDNQTSINLNEKVQSRTNPDAYAWAFVGNPFIGFEIVNKAAGSSMVLSNPKDGSDGTRYPLLKAKSELSANDVCEYFIQKSTNISGVEGFYIGYENDGKKRMNRRDGNLAYWDDGANGGSTFTVEAVYSIAEQLDFIEESHAFAITSVRGTLCANAETGKVSVTSKVGNGTEKYDWFSVVKSSNGFYYLYNIGEEKFVGYDSNKDDHVILESVPTKPVIISEGSGNYPFHFIFQDFWFNLNGSSYPAINGWKDVDEGNSFRFIDKGAYDLSAAVAAVEAANTSAASIEDLDDRSAYMMIAERGTLYSKSNTVAKQNNSSNDKSTDEQFAFIKSAKEGGYYIYNVYAKKFMNSDMSLSEYPREAAIIFSSSQSERPFRFKFDDKHHINIGGNGYLVINDWSKEDEGNRFQLLYAGAYDLNDAIAAVENYESPTKTLTDYGYATLFTDHAVAIPEGATAYYVTVVGDVATLNEIEDVIPANTGVVVKGTASSDYQFEYTTAAATTDVSDNKMVGYIVDTPITGDDAISYYAVNYKTVNSEKVPGFFAPKGATTPTGNFTAKAGKAYLKVEGAAGSSIVMRFGDATMVENLLKTQDAAIYDLTGRKVAQPERGIYIVNGKKMFFK